MHRTVYICPIIVPREIIRVTRAKVWALQRWAAIACRWMEESGSHELRKVVNGRAFVRTSRHFRLRVSASASEIRGKERLSSVSS